MLRRCTVRSVMNLVSELDLLGSPGTGRRNWAGSRVSTGSTSSRSSGLVHSVITVVQRRTCRQDRGAETPASWAGVKRQSLPPHCGIIENVCDSQAGKFARPVRNRGRACRGCAGRRRGCPAYESRTYSATRVAAGIPRLRRVEDVKGRRYASAASTA